MLTMLFTSFTPQAAFHTFPSSSGRRGNASTRFGTGCIVEAFLNNYLCTDRSMGRLYIFALALTPCHGLTPQAAFHTFHSSSGHRGNASTRFRTGCLVEASSNSLFSRKPVLFSAGGIPHFSFFKRPSWHRIDAFQDRLRAQGVWVSVRASRGDDDAAACGQLATNKFAAKEKARAATS